MIGVGSVGVFFDADMSGYNAGMKSAKNQLMTFERSANRVGGNLQKFGRRASMATLPISAGVAANIFQFGKFDQKMIESTSIMGNLSADIQKEMRNVALTMSQDTIFSADKLAESYFFLASAGMNAEQSIAALGPVTQFATAGAFDLANATDLLTDAQSALGLTNKDTQKNMMGMVRVSDVLVKANTLANASVQQFSEALTNKAGASIKTLNKDLEEGVAVLAAFADQGVKGQVAGEQLAMVLTFLEDAALNNKTAFDKYGFSVFDQEGKFRNMADVVGNLEQVLKGKNDETRSAILAELGFASRTQKTLKVLMGTSDKIREYEKGLRAAGGTTKDVADKQSKSFNAQMTRLGNTIRVTSILLGEQLAPGISFVADKAQAAVQWFNQLNPAIKKTVSYAMLAVAVMGPLAIGLGTIIKLLPILRLGLVSVQMAGAKMLVPFLVAAAPILAVVGAVAAVGLAFFVSAQEGDTFFERMSNGWKANKQDVMIFFDTLKIMANDGFNYMQFAVLSMGLHLKAFWDKSLARGVVFFDKIGNGLDWIKNNWQEAFWGMLETLGTWAFNVGMIMYNVFSNLKDNLFKLFQAIWDKIKNPGSDFKVDFKPILDGWDEGLKKSPVLRKGGVFQSQLEAGLEDTLGGIDAELSDNLVHAYNGIYNKAKETAKVIEDAGKAAEEPAADAPGAGGAGGSTSSVPARLQNAVTSGSAEAIRIVNNANSTMQAQNSEKKAQGTREEQLKAQQDMKANLRRLATATVNTSPEILNINY